MPVKMMYTDTSGLLIVFVLPTPLLSLRFFPETVLYMYHTYAEAVQSLTFAKTKTSRQTWSKHIKGEK